MADLIHLNVAWRELEAYRTHSVEVRSAPAPWMWRGSLVQKTREANDKTRATLLASTALLSIGAGPYTFEQVRQARDVVGSVIDSLASWVDA